MNARARLALVLSLCVAMLTTLMPVAAGGAAPPDLRTAVTATAISVVPSSTPDTANQWAIVGTRVDHLASAPDGTLYIAGEFSHIGPLTGSGAMITTSTNEVLKPWPFVNTVSNWGVEAVVEDGAGGYYIGGAFTEVGGFKRASLAHILPSGAVDPDWSVDVTSSTNPHVRALYRVGDTLYIGGDFTSVAGVARSNAAAVSCSNAAVLGWDPQVNSGVHSMLASGDYVYLGGLFTYVHGDVHVVLARVDATTGEPGSWTCDGNGTVETIALQGGRLFVAGYFNTMGGAARHHIAAIDAASGVVDTMWDPGVGTIGEPDSLAATGTTLYVAGTYDSIAGVTRNRLAALDISVGSTGTATGWDPAPAGWVKGIRLRGDTLYACGTFTTMAGQPRSRAASFDISSGTPVLTTFDALADNQLDVIDAGGSTAYVGGSLSIAGMKPRRNLASFAPDGSLTDWKPDPDQFVLDMSYADGTLYCGGNFTMIAGQARQSLAAFDKGGALTAWDPSPNGAIYAVLARPDKVYVGGGFSAVGGGIPGGLAELSASPSTGTASAWQPRLTGGVVNAIEESGGVVYAGGGFSGVDDGSTTIPRTRLAAFNTTTIAPLPWSPALTGPSPNVRDLAIVGSRVFVGGVFDSVGGVARTGIAAMAADGTGSVDASFAPNPNMGLRRVRALADGLYVGGDFTSIGGVTREYAALLDPQTGTVKDWKPIPNDRINDFARLRDRLAVGGTFTTLGFGTVTVPKIAQFAARPLAPDLARMNGADRWEVAVNLAKEAFPDWKTSAGTTVTTVIVACGSDAKAADPLGAAGLSGAAQAPILLVRNDTKALVPPQTIAALQQIAAARGGAKPSIIVVGGPATVTTKLWNALRPYASSMQRIAGADRYAVAANVAYEIKKRSGNVNPPFVLIAAGNTPARFWEPLALGPIAARMKAPILLVKGSSVPAATSAAVKSLAPVATNRYLGAHASIVNEAARGALGATRIPGVTADRTVFAAAVADFAIGRTWLSASKVGVTNKLADALGGGAAMGMLGGPILYTNANGSLAPATTAFMTARTTEIDDVYVIGGPTSVPESTIAGISAIWP